MRKNYYHLWHPKKQVVKKVKSNGRKFPNKYFNSPTFNTTEQERLVGKSGLITWIRSKSSNFYLNEVETGVQRKID